jgi:hypothetical protein
MNRPSPAKPADGDKRLIKILSDYARRSPGAGFGFTAQGRQAQAKRPLALVCRLDTIEPARIKACIEAGADAIEVSTAVPETALESLQETTVVWGLALRGASYDAWEPLLGPGETTHPADWITLAMDDDARFLGLKGVAKVLEVEIGATPETLRGIAVSGADAIVAIRGKGNAGGPLTVADMLRLRLLAELLKQPILVSAAFLTPGKGALRLVKESGAAGILLESSDPEAIRTLVAGLAASAEEGAG